eukprot:TRINITY_DN2115_c0_g1_i7.p1 TRINITY_DN2115_c0_g1~~TRINITY_DN2115_c0_g1_i7.p1  ORF type:complete len:122 (+),score=20.97 TRINITY_DN2115_c0_g1_i7:1-366(+)
MAQWQTGTFDCCAEPGGMCLCLRASCCGCTVWGDISERAQLPGGFIAGCCGLLLCEGLTGCGCLYTSFMAVEAAKKAGVEESWPHAICCSCCCNCCYSMQVWRELELKGIKGSAPGQMEMQ